MSEAARLAREHEGNSAVKSKSTTYRGVVATLCTIAFAACSPSPAPGDGGDGGDANSGADATPSDSMTTDVAADRVAVDVASDTGTIAPDASEDGAADASPDAADSAADDVVDASMDSGFDSGIDSGVDTGVDTGADSGSDAANDGEAGAGACSRSIDGTIALPAAGATTTVTTSLAAGGVGGVNGTVSCVSATIGGSERIFTLDVTTRTSITVRAVAAVMTTDTVIAIRRDCSSAAATSEVACNDDEGGGSTNSSLSTTLEPGRYFVVLDEYGDAAMATGGNVTITVRTVTTEPNATCGTATPLNAGVMVGADLRDGLVDSMTCTNTQSGPQVFYSYTIPAGQETTFTAAPGAGTTTTPYVHVFSDCATRGSCLTTSSEGGAPLGIARIANTTASPRTVIVSVGGPTVMSAGRFTLIAQNSPAAPPPANAMCSAPTTLATDGVPVNGTTIGAVEARSTFDCAPSSTDAPAVFYRVVVPAGRTALVQATSTTPGFSPRINGVLGCATLSCAGTTAPAIGIQPSSFTYRNTTAGDVTLLVFVAGNSRLDRGNFTIAATLPPPPTNLTCASAATLAVGSTLRAQIQSQASMLSSATCEVGSTGAVLYYSMAVPAMTSVQVRVSPLSGDPTLRVRADCATNACITSADTRLDRQSETVIVANRTASMQTYIVELGSRDVTSSGVFDLSATAIVERYDIEQLATAACRTLPPSATDAMLRGDDVTITAPVMLPFTLQYFGASATHFSASTNGVAQLYTSSAGTPSAAFENEFLPSPTAPTGAVGAFWDDLRTDQAASHGVSYATIGAAPNREFVIEWRASSFSVANDLRFQLVAVEGTNVIEFNYCAMNSTTMDQFNTGISATIGMQSPDTTAGVTFAHARAMAIGGATMASPNRLRFIPR